MPAQFRIDQVTPGAGVAGRSRHDLVPGEIISLVATSPAPGPGVTYAWALLDKRGSTAVLSGSTGQTVSIGVFGLITRPCSFLIELTTNDNGVITKSRRIASVRTLNGQLRVPVFPETSPDANNLAVHDPDTSTDNALYANRSGLGVAEQNWAGWSEWAWELVNVVESSIGSSGPPSGPAGGDLALTYPNPRVAKLFGVAIDASAAAPLVGGVLRYDGTNYKSAVIVGKLYEKVVVGNALNGDTAADCDFLDPGDGTGIEAALAALTGFNGDILVRTGVYDLVTGGVVTPLVVPTGVSLRFAGMTNSIVHARMTPGVSESMSVFDVQSGASLSDVTVFIDGPGATNGGSEDYFINVATASTMERVLVTMGAIIAGQWTQFGPIRKLIKFTNRSTLVDVTCGNVVSLRDSGASFDFITFDGVENLLDGLYWRGFALTRCVSHGPTAVRGGDIAFRTNFGPGTFTDCAFVNPRLYGFHLNAGATAVRVLNPYGLWAFTDTVGHSAFLFGDLTTSGSVLDCEVNGGYVRGVSTTGSPAVYFSATSGGSVNRNKVHGLTIREFSKALKFLNVSGSLDYTDVQLCKFKDVTTVYDTDSNDTNTVIDNNVNDVGGGA